jgi:hypothetical protein
MRLDFAILAEDAAAAEGKLYIHGGGLGRIDAPQLPWVSHLAVAMKFTASLDELGTHHELGLLFLAPDGTTAMDFPMISIDIPIDPPGEDAEELAVVAVIGIGVVAFAAAGWYEFEVRLDTDVIERLRLRIVEVVASEVAETEAP